jgi:lysophospholipid acyltransferase (LPLAT)-like uncharacterized protein
VDQRKRSSKRTKRFLAWLAGTLGPWLIRGLHVTWRVRRVGIEHFEARGKKGQRGVYAMWHQNVPAGSAVHRGKQLSVLVSSHRDGEIIARTIRRMGYGVVRGSSSRGGARALRQMLGQMEHEQGLVFTPDGPRGPRHSVAVGAIYLAAATGRPLIATGFSAKRAWHLSSWDRMEFPKLFTQVVVAYAPPIYVERTVMRDPEALEQARQEFGAALHAAEERADQVLAKQSS